MITQVKRTLLEDLQVIKSMLRSIDNSLDIIERIDPYGDLTQNFEDIDRVRHTTRLIKLIDDDIKSGYWNKRKED